MMTNEELMRPRYKVIADYPGNVQPIGHIHSVIGDMASTIYWCNEKDKYPHLFKRLEWWEEREEMPEYVKHEHGWIDKHIGINHAGDSFVFIGQNDVIEWRFKHFTPATAAEYEQYINQKEKQ